MLIGLVLVTMHRTHSKTKEVVTHTTSFVVQKMDTLSVGYLKASKYYGSKNYMDALRISLELLHDNNSLTPYELFLQTNLSQIFTLNLEIVKRLLNTINKHLIISRFIKELN